ncbi:MAG: hypothetical protein R3F61_29020 [Myxococcota bacterium]
MSSSATQDHATGTIIDAVTISIQRGRNSAVERVVATTSIAMTSRPQMNSVRPMRPSNPKNSW